LKNQRGSEEIRLGSDKKCLIFVIDGVQNAILPIVKNILPERVYLIASSNANLETAVEIGKNIRQELRQIDVRYDLTETDETIKYLHHLQRLLVKIKTDGYTESQIGVGLTSKQEKTIAILGIFSGLFGLCLFYYIRPQDAVDKGKVITLVDPDDIWGFIEFRNGITSFNSLDYEHAMEIFSKLSEKAAAIRSRRILEVLTLLSETYLNWDSLRYEEAWRKINQCMSRLQECLAECGEESKELFEYLKKNADFLNAIRSNNRLFMTVDLWLNGMRRYYEKKCDDAIIRFYRTLELCAQYRLSKWGINTSRFSRTCNSIPKDKLEMFLETIKAKAPPETIGLFHALTLLRILGDPFALRIPKEALARLMHSRNNCILVHGIDVTSDHTVLKFASEVEAILKILFEIENVNYPDVKNQATFITLDRDTLNKIIFG
jgi:CRISPR-associated protein (TIGR02710 family)